MSPGRPGRHVAGLLGCVLALLGALLAPSAAHASPAHPSPPLPLVRPGTPQQHGHGTLFGGGYDRAGRVVYHSFRIPSLVRTTQGSLLAFAEGRVWSARDHGEIDLVMKRSTNGGRSWSTLQVVVGAGNGTWGNPTAVTDRRTGTVFLFMNWNSAAVSQFGGDGTARITRWGQRRVFLTSSTDDGRTWSPPADLTRTLLPAGRAWDAIGPGNGIQTESGPHPGRLVVPALGRNIYSDDHGRTWKMRRLPRGTSEGTVLELLDGTLLRNDRAAGPIWERGRSRWVARGTIEDGFRPFRPQPQLIDAKVAGSAIRYGDRPSRILFLNPASASDRCRMTVRVSYDDGATWPVARPVHGVSPGEVCGVDKGGYSSMAITPGGMVGALIEFAQGPTAAARRSIEFHRFNLAWVLNGAREPALQPTAVIAMDRKAAAAQGVGYVRAPAPRPVVGGAVRAGSGSRGGGSAGDAFAAGPLEGETLGGGVRGTGGGDGPRAAWLGMALLLLAGVGGAVRPAVVASVPPAWRGTPGRGGFGG